MGIDLAFYRLIICVRIVLQSTASPSGQVQQNLLNFERGVVETVVVAASSTVGSAGVRRKRRLPSRRLGRSTLRSWMGFVLRYLS